jgi:hypothetical protein
MYNIIIIIIIKLIMALYEVQGNDGMDLLALGGVNASNEGKTV